MKVTKKTMLLAALPKVNLLSLAANAMDDGVALITLSVENCKAVKDYEENVQADIRSFSVKVSVNGGEAVEKTVGGALTGDSFTGVIYDANAGDGVKVILEIDPSKADEYSAGTMEKSATVS